MAIGVKTRMMLGALSTIACSGSSSNGGRQQATRPQPDERPTMINTDPPFHYPVALYARKLQGNVTLRLFVDGNGKTVSDSTRVEESSGYSAFDSAAVSGAKDLRFIPAKLQGEPVGVTIL